MILSLLLVPLTQQVVQFYSCTVLDPGVNATIPKTNYASAELSQHIGAGLNSIGMDVQAVMNGAIYDSEPKQVSYVCPSGTCTFEGVYHTMGWCSHCKDISDQVEIRSSHTSMGSNTNFTLPSSNLTATVGPRTFVMGQRNPNNPVQVILGLGLSNETHGLPLPDTLWGNRGYGAAECSISACVRSFSSTVESGKLTENLVSTSETWNQGQLWFNSIDVSCLNPTETQALHNAGYDFDPKTTSWIAYNLSALAEEAFNPTVLNGTKTTIRPECIYQTYQGEVYSLSAYIGTMFTGAVSYGPGDLSGPSILQTIFKEGNVTFSTIGDTFDRLAQALTVWTREQGGNVTGLVYRSDTCVGALWGWLAYPLSVTIGTMILLAWTIDRTRREEGSAQDYKSSPLALFFHRLGNVGSEGPASDIETRDRLQKKAKTMRVVFQGTNKVWRFIEVD